MSNNISFKVKKDAIIEELEGIKSDITSYRAELLTLIITSFMKKVVFKRKLGFKVEKVLKNEKEVIDFLLKLSFRGYDNFLNMIDERLEDDYLKVGTLIEMLESVYSDEINMDIDHHWYIVRLRREIYSSPVINELMVETLKLNGLYFTFCNEEWMP